MQNETEQNIKETTNDELARMIQEGFLEVKAEIKTVADDLIIVTDNLRAVKDDTEEIKAEIIKKVDKVDHNTLTYRVDKLEKKFA